MPGFNIDPNFIKQQQEVMRSNALKNLKDKPPETMSSGRLFAIVGSIFLVLIMILLLLFESA